MKGLPHKDRPGSRELVRHWVKAPGANLYMPCVSRKQRELAKHWVKDISLVVVGLCVCAHLSRKTKEEAPCPMPCVQ